MEFLLISYLQSLHLEFENIERCTVEKVEKEMRKCILFKVYESDRLLFPLQYNKFQNQLKHKIS